MPELSAESCNQNSIRRHSRNLIVFLGLLTMLTLACGFQAMHLRMLQEEADHVRENAMNLADRLAYGSDRLTSSVRGFAASGEDVYLDDFNRELEQDRNRENAVTGLLALQLNSSERDLLERAKQNSDRLVGMENQAIALAKQHKMAAAVPLVFGEPYRTAKKSIMDPIEQFRGALSDRLGDEAESLDQQARNWATAGLCLLVINSLATGAVLHLFFLRRVVRPLTAINASLRALLADEKDVTICYQDEASEVGDIARSLERYRRASDEAEQQRWIKSQLAEIAAALHNAETPNEFGECLLSKLVPLLRGGFGAFYCNQDQDGRLCSWGRYGGCQDFAEGFDRGEGLVGQCQLEQKILVLNDLPDGYVKISSGSGAAQARSLILVPVVSEGETLAVIELATFQAPTPLQMEVLEAVAPTVCLNLEILQRNLKAQKLAVELQGYRTSLNFSQEEAQRVLFAEERS